MPNCDQFNKNIKLFIWIFLSQFSWNIHKPPVCKFQLIDWHIELKVIFWKQTLLHYLYINQQYFLFPNRSLTLNIFIILKYKILKLYDKFFNRNDTLYVRWITFYFILFAGHNIQLSLFSCNRYSINYSTKLFVLFSYPRKILVWIYWLNFTQIILIDFMGFNKQKFQV